MKAKLISIHKDKGDNYTMRIEVAGIDFESETIRTIPVIAEKFGMTEKEVKKLIGNPKRF